MACTLGYFGDFCNITCPRGSFGLECAGKCRPVCPVDNCHHVHGCQNSTTDMTQTANSGFHSHLTRATAQPKISSDVSFFAEQTNDLLVTEKSSIPGLSSSRLYLLVCIGTMSLILVLLTITYFFKKKKEKISQRVMVMHVHCQNDSLHPSLDPVNNDIAGCSRLEMPKLSSESRSSACTFKKEGNRKWFQSKKNQSVNMS